nr:reverse transcriptase domain-containing protein [Tanacetum cinerariifolium]
MTPFYEYLTEGVLPAKKKKARTVRRKAGRYAVISEVLYKKSFLGPWLRCVGPLQANYVLREIHEGSCSMHAGPRSVVAKALRLGYFWTTMHTDARNLIRKCKDCQVHRPVPKNPQEKLTPITSPWPFYKWRIDIAGPFPEGPGKVKLLIVAIDYFTKWIEAKPVASITGTQVAIQEARSKAKMEGYFNARVRRTSFRPGDLVYRNNEASHAEDGGKLGPKWEGPYEVTEALGKGAYKLKDRNGHTLPRTWNIRNLKNVAKKKVHVISSCGLIIYLGTTLTFRMSSLIVIS